MYGDPSFDSWTTVHLEDHLRTPENEDFVTGGGGGWGGNTRRGFVVDLPSKTSPRGVPTVPASSISDWSPRTLCKVHCGRDLLPWTHQTSNELSALPTRRASCPKGLSVLSPPPPPKHASPVLVLSCCCAGSPRRLPRRQSACCPAHRPPGTFLPVTPAGGADQSQGGGGSPLANGTRCASLPRQRPACRGRDTGGTASERAEV